MNGFAMVRLGVPECDLRVFGPVRVYGPPYSRLLWRDFGTTWLLTQYVGPPRQGTFFLGEIIVRPRSRGGLSEIGSFPLEPDLIRRDGFSHSAWAAESSYMKSERQSAASTGLRSDRREADTTSMLEDRLHKEACAFMESAIPSSRPGFGGRCSGG